MQKKLIGLGILFLAASELILAAEDPAAKDPAAGNMAVDTIDAFEKLFGVTEGRRRNHTKGFCFSATLIPQDKAILKYSDSPLFTANSTVVGRLSHKGGNHAAPDHKPADYGMGLSIAAANGEQHRMSMNTLEFFPVATPQAFAELTRAQAEGKAAVAAFKAKSPDLQRFKAHEAAGKKSLTPYEASTYNSLNSFYLVAADGEKTAVRWSFVPTRTQQIALAPQQDFFFENMQRNLKRHGVAWDMVVTLANPDDAIDNAAIPWRGEHRRIVAASLEVEAISRDEDGPCEAINFDPLVLSTGFAPSGDPLLPARRKAYAVSFGRRLSEQRLFE